MALVFVAIAALGAGAGLAWWLWSPGLPELARGWPSTVVLLAGDGVRGRRDGEARQARFSDPFGIATTVDGTIYVSDGGESHRIRRITADGRVTTVAGGDRGFVDGPTTVARFDTPSGLAVDSAGTLYIADTGNNAVRALAPDGVVRTIAGGEAGYQDGPAWQARFNGPIGIAVDRDGRLLVADSYNDRIRAISADGIVSTIAGGPLPGYADGPAALALFDTPAGVAAGEDGVIHVADTGNGVIRRIDRDGFVSTRPPAPADGLVRPAGIATAPEGSVYVSDDRGRIIEISADDSVRTLAGSSSGFRDGQGASARFRRPAGIAITAPGRLLVADSGNAMIRVVAAPSRADLAPLAPDAMAPAFDAGQFARAPLLWPLAPMEGPHEVAGTLGESRGTDAERLHSGIDIRGEHGDAVLAVRSGVVVSPVSTGAFGTLNEWLRIGELTYVHLRAGRGRRDEPMDPTRFVANDDETGRVSRIRVKRGARFEAGDTIGTINPFNHVHLNVGWPGEEHNPLRFGLLHFKDTIPPTIARGGIRLFDESGQPLVERVKRRVAVAGRIQIVLDAWDQADGNRPQRRLGLYELGYQLLHAGGQPVAGFEFPRVTIRFDTLLSDTDAARLVFASGSGIPYYGRRRTRFLYVVTNTFRDGIAAAGYLDTATLEPGQYIIRVHAADIGGNVAVSGRDLPITVEAGVAGS